METAAATFDRRVIGVVLTGTGCDASDGVQAVKQRGGLVIVQDEATSAFWGMPSAAIATGVVDYVLPLERIAPAFDALVIGLPVEDAQPTEGRWCRVTANPVMRDAGRS